MLENYLTLKLLHMRFPFLVLIFLLVSCEEKTENTAVDFPTQFEASKGMETATYEETIDFYIKLAQEFPEINIQTIGTTDSDRPLHMVTYNIDGDFNFNKIREDKRIILVNNGIHPGESDGIDATMLLYRDLAIGKLKAPWKTVLVTIPIYNVGGALNRNHTTRANQNGPASYGFRGNARNYDLNRDFIKSDTKNARTFAKIYHLVQPDVFIDNHVSNGADYQYTLSHLFTQHNKLGGELGTYLHDTLMPALQDSLLAEQWDITPYVNVFNKPPETGFSQFLDHPRYSTGYTTLWHTLGMMVETHMLKPYKDRVEGTYMLMKKMIGIVEQDGERISQLRKNALQGLPKSGYYPIDWKVDTTRSTTLTFKGFKADTLMSEVTGANRLKFNREQPFTAKVNYQDFFVPGDSIRIPEAYVIGKQWTNALALLELNNIIFTRFKKDTLLTVESYSIEAYETGTKPYEGHYPHYATKVSAQKEIQQITTGDVLVPVDQPGFRYLLETLEPQAVDSFFNWNFFDTILQQKEGFSPYVFEDTAVRMLQQDSLLRKEFNGKKEVDQAFAQNWYAQLDWLFERSEHYEKAHLRYPVYRLPRTD